jgi:ribosomal protein L37AE/L43A
MYGQEEWSMTDNKSVFISYSSKDARFVNQIVKVLKEMGITYWKAPEMIPAGSSYAREIPKAIRECDVFLLVLSKASQTSIWVEKELDSAINLRKTIVPVKLDEVPLCELFRFYLNNVQMISYEEDSAHNFAMLNYQLSNLLQVEEASEDMFEDVEEYSVTKRKNLREQNRRENRISVESGKQDNKGSRKSDVFVVNKVPTECKYCHGELKDVGAGIFKCLECGQENYDYLRTVRNYLEKEGARSVAVISRETGVPRHAVDYFLRQEFLEIPKLAPERLSCQRCGAPIRTGYLCDKCKNPKQDRDGKQEKAATNMKGKWHTGHGF